MTIAWYRFDCCPSFHFISVATVDLHNISIEYRIHAQDFVWMNLIENTHYHMHACTRSLIRASSIPEAFNNQFILTSQSFILMSGRHNSKLELNTWTHHIRRGESTQWEHCSRKKKKNSKLTLTEAVSACTMVWCHFHSIFTIPQRQFVEYTQNCMLT